MIAHHSHHNSRQSPACTRSTVVAIVVAFIVFRAMPAVAQQATTPILPSPARRDAQIPAAYPETKLAQRLPPIASPIATTQAATPPTITPVIAEPVKPAETLILPPLANSLEEYPVTHDKPAPSTPQPDSTLFAQETLPPGEGAAATHPAKRSPWTPNAISITS
jgi:hypothetical protein